MTDYMLGILTSSSPKSQNTALNYFRLFLGTNLVLASKLIQALKIINATILVQTTRV